ncbi:MAG: hypothetical protein JWN01_282 [Patescibacteria group bacterium]|nr:hypothetical protein [Patescibacteria group bacterium]
MSKIFRRTHDPIWHLQLGVIVVIILQLLTAPALLPYNKFLLIGLEILLMAALAVVTPDAYHRVSRPRRTLTMSLITIIAVVNMVSLLLLLEVLINGHTTLTGRELLANGVAIYVTNIFMFALGYWEMDGGGPDRRTTRRSGVDFLFTQMAHPKFSPAGWLPGFTDYLYLSATNVTNFASADTVPLSHRAKILMMIQSITALVTVVLVAARAISILG